MKRIILLSILFTLIFSACLTAQTDSSLTDKAWEAFNQGKVSQVENLFEQALDENPQNIRAYLGLSLFYESRGQDFKAHKSFMKAMKYSDNPAPYLFAEEKHLKYSQLEKPYKSESINYYEAMIKHTDKLRILETMGNENIGNLYLTLGKYRKAEKYFKKIKSISTWKLIGPFDNISASGFEKVYGPEQEYDMEKSYRGKNGAPARWFPVKKHSRERWIFLNNYFGMQSAVYYAAAFVYSPEKEPVYLRIGTSGSVKMFLNDEAVLSVPEERNNGLDTYIVQTELQQGWNKILLKLGHSEIKSCNFLLRITDTTGTPIVPEKISTDAQAYISKPNALVKYIPNFAEEYFKQQIAQYPSRPENYLFLADVYSKNDKSTLAELILKKGLQTAPRNTTFLEKLLEAYSRADKYNEALATLNFISKIDETLPYALAYKIRRALNNENLDIAEETITRLSEVVPESIMFYELIIKFYIEKDQLDECKKYIVAACDKYPAAWKFIYYKIKLAQLTDKDISKAIKINKAYVKKYKEETALSELTSLYLSSGNNLEWLKYFREIFKRYPSVSYYYFKLGAIFAGLEDYSKAEDYVKQAMEIRPGDYRYWEKLGDVARMDGREKDAILNYQTALDYMPMNYEVYSKIRDLEKKPAFFNYFPESNIDSLRANAPSANEYPDDNLLILLNYKRRVVYKRGGSETLTEYLAKTFNHNGVDRIKQYNIPLNPHLQNVIIEKAVVFKEDGTEINAAINKTEIVFKSLEPGDCIFVKWKTKDYHFGKLARHFWDEFYFNSFVPMKNSIYAIYTEGEKDFGYKTRNISLQPKELIKPGGKLFLWEVSDAAKIEYEPYMPSFEETAQYLYISSIPDWKFVANWYQDLAQSKAKPVYEIKEKVNQLFYRNENLNPEQKVRIVYDYITENIRYSNVSFRQSGLIPQKAADVLGTKIGDCKDKTTLFIAMMQELGIEAHYVLVNTNDNDSGFENLPSIGFNHAIAAVSIDSSDHYYDLTAYNYPLNTLPSGDNGSFALKITAETERPFYIPVSDIVQNEISRERDVKILPDNKLEVEIKNRRVGKIAASFRDTYRNEGQKEKDKILLNTIGGNFQDVNLIDFTTDNLDTLKEDVNYTYKYTASNFMTEAGNLQIFKMHWIDGYELAEVLSAKERVHPLILNENNQVNRTEKVTIHLPANLIPVEFPETVEYSSSFGAYKVTYSFKPGVLKAERIFNYKKSKILPAEYQAFKTFYLNMVINDARQLVFKKL